jgi:class 3 adenylate cyclase
MIEAIIRKKRAGGHRYVAGSCREFVELFGYPLPVLPVGEANRGKGETIQAMLPAELETLTTRHMAHLWKMVVGKNQAHAGHGDDSEREFSDYLARLLHHILRDDRRLGLLNLFWLAYAKVLAGSLDTSTADEATRRARWRLWPLLSGLFSRTQRRVIESLDPGDRRMVHFHYGHDYGWGVVESLFNDPFALMTRDVRLMDSKHAAGPNNPQATIDGEAFVAVLELLAERHEKAESVDAREYRRSMERRIAGHHAPIQFPGAESMDRISPFHPMVVHYHLSTEDTVDILVKRKPAMKVAIGQRGGWKAFLDEVDRILGSLRRTEYLQLLQESIVPVPSHLDEAQFKELFQEGRLFKFSTGLPAVNNFRRVVILFADIREFTKASGMAISERELTERLYDVFDPLVHVVVSLGGTVDKFTGDGMMVTFGAVGSLPDPDLQALRCAIAIQEAMTRLRAVGRTEFQMGVAIHAGRVFVANFIHDARTAATTVIGRQVNLAGRLSSARTLTPGESSAEDSRSREATPPTLSEIQAATTGAVFLDAEGGFYNVGVATSGQFLMDLRQAVPMEAVKIGGRQGFRFVDRYLRSEVLFHYVGDATFKGVAETTPVYGISWRRDETNAPGGGAGSEGG